MKNEKGITLAALVITVIILIIISSIATFSGVSTIRYTRYNKAKSEMELMQTTVNSWYEDYNKLSDEEKSTYISGIGTTTAGLDTNTLTKTEQGAGIESGTKPVNSTSAKYIQDYRYLSGQETNKKLGLNVSFDFLVNIPEREVVLFGGVLYNGKTYFTAEDFGLLNVPSTSMEGIDFKLTQGDNTDIIIYNLKIKDELGKTSDISKFIVEYKKEGETTWSDVTASLTKFNDENDGKVKYKFSAPEKETAKYDVRVSTIDKEPNSTYSVDIKSPWVLVTFNENGGNVNTASKLVKIGDTYGDLPTPTRDGYTFKGWNGKNLLNYNDLSSYAKNVGIVVDENGNVSDTSPSGDPRTWGYTQSNWHVRLNPGTYTVTLHFSTQSTQGNNIFMLYTEEDEERIAYASLMGKDTVTYTFTLSEEKNIGIMPKGYDGVYRVQLEENSEATEYEPYYVTSSTKVVQDKDHTLTAIWEENT